ncbi:hypothetical protein KP509_21G015200 [Ceratopteris richardii]|uniref:Uncharacterized protein n=1 Tax=Ceratopteris richardii TaxID=49495 RepID=A0A8T2SB33_CERRI|nr:hypothetical protein KP509_21G015200 [Ceratopteris richardii]
MCYKYTSNCTSLSLSLCALSDIGISSEGPCDDEANFIIFSGTTKLGTKRSRRRIHERKCRERYGREGGEEVGEFMKENAESDMEEKEEKRRIHERKCRERYGREGGEEVGGSLMQLFGSVGALIGVSRITAAAAVIKGSLAVAIEGVAAAFLARLVLVDVKELLLEDGAADGWIAAIALEYRGTMPRNAGHEPNQLAAGAVGRGGRLLIEALQCQ